MTEPDEFTLWDEDYESLERLAKISNMIDEKNYLSNNLLLSV